MKIYEYPVKLFDGTCFKNFKDMNSKERESVVLKSLAVALAVGIVALIAFALISPISIIVVVPTLFIASGLSAFCALTANARGLIPVDLPENSHTGELKRNVKDLGGNLRDRLNQAGNVIKSGFGKASEAVEN